MRCVPCLLLLLVAPMPAFGQPAQVQRVEIVSSGTYRVEIVSRETNANTATGNVAKVTNVKLINADQSIEGRLGVMFGQEYRIVGQPQGGKVSIRQVIRFPGPGLHNPATGKTSHVDDDIYQRTIGPGTFVQGYGFENPWEIVPGTWTFEIWYGDRKLASSNFTVRKP